MTDKEKLEKLKKLADAMYYAANYLTTDASRLHKAMDEYHKFIINEYHKEEYSEDLEEFINTIKLLTSNTALLTFEYGCREGAKWQKEQLLAKAVDGEVTYGKSLAIPSLGYRLDKEKLDFGDKVKVIIIKKD